MNPKGDGAQKLQITPDKTQKALTILVIWEQGGGWGEETCLFYPFQENANYCTLCKAHLQEYNTFMDYSSPWIYIFRS